MPFYMINHNLILQSQYSIQCTVYTDKWVELSFNQYIAQVRAGGVTRYTYVYIHSSAVWSEL